MSKELEAFIRLDHNTKRYKGRKEDLDIVFNTIKTYEMEHTLRIRLENIIWENAKKLKALQIIKEKGNFISFGYDEYDHKYYIYDNEYCMHNEITK